MDRAFAHWLTRSREHDPSFRDAFMSGYAAASARVAVQVEAEIARRHRDDEESDAITAALRQLLVEMEG
jgi:hypothetical protein